MLVKYSGFRGAESASRINSSEKTDCSDVSMVGSMLDILKVEADDRGVMPVAAA